MTCNLSRTGPRTGALAVDNKNVGNLAYNPTLEACGGASGSCLSINGDLCCIGTMSYEYQPATGQSACINTCSNYWSSISSARPLEDLWAEVQVDLPKGDPFPLSGQQNV